MSILIATPMYGGQCTEAYFKSCIKLQRALFLSNVPHDWLTTSNESLITRGRNTSVATFLKETPFERLMFIDADIGFEADDVAKLWNLDVDVAVGAYQMKKPGSSLAAWKNGKLIKITDGMKSPFEVDFAGTGFMMIKRTVFERMMADLPQIEYIEGQVEQCWAFFDTELHEFNGKRVYLSEDYFFCQRWHEMGGKIVLDPTIRLTHIGNYAYGRPNGSLEG